MSDDPIADRRQRALETFEDTRASAAVEWSETGINEAIEVAMQVRITDDIIGMIPATPSDAYDIACDIFRAAGFEVVE